jgi:Fibronectin type III domain
VGDRQVALSWTAPDDGGSPINGYDISVSPAPANQTSPIHVGASPTSAIITGLTDNTTYTFAVRADNAVGPSGYSPSVAATPLALPAAPTITSAGPGDKSVGLTWKAVPGADDYRVSTSGTITDLTSTGTTTTIGNLANGKAYSFTVAAHNASGWGPASAVANVTAGGQLSALSSLPSVPATAADHHAVLDLSVSWTSASVPPTATGVRVCVQPTSAGNPTFSSCPSGSIQDVSAAVTHAVFGSLVAGRAYRETAWPDYSNKADFGAPRSGTINGSAFSNTAIAKITDGASVALSARLLVGGTTTVLAGQPVMLWQKAAGATTWSLTTSAVFHTNSAGVVSAAVRPSVTTSYQWRYTGTSAHLATVGNEVVDVALRPL